MNMNRNKRNDTNKSVTVVHNIELYYFNSIVLAMFALFASAQILIPLKPVSIALQAIMISIIGLSYFLRPAFITLLSNLSLGAIDMPMSYLFSYINLKKN